MNSTEQMYADQRLVRDYALLQVQEPVIQAKFALHAAEMAVAQVTDPGLNAELKDGLAAAQQLLGTISDRLAQLTQPRGKRP